MLKKILIFGISGQDGSYLADYLIKKKKYKIYGISRKKNISSLKKLKISNKIKILTLTKNSYQKKLKKILKLNFHDIYFCGGQSSVKDSFFLKEYETYESQILPVKIILEYIRNQKKKSKFLYFASSEIFGDKKKKKIKENDTKNPLSPYALAKLASFEMIKSYREMFGIPVFNVILFNHESPLRDKRFVIMKLILAIKKIKKNKDKIRMGNINVSRDWGWAPEYMQGCYKLMKSKGIEDYIIATGETVPLKKVLNMIFKIKNLNWKRYISYDYKNLRRTDIKENFANISKIQKKIKWKPKVKIREIVKKLYNHKFI